MEEAHLHLSDIKSTWSGQNLTLETQLSRLSRQVAEETSEKRKILMNFDELQEKLKICDSDLLRMDKEIEQRNNKVNFEYIKLKFEVVKYWFCCR